MSTSVRRGMNRPSRSSGIVPPRFSSVKNVSKRGSRYRSAEPRSNFTVTRFRDLHSPPPMNPALTKLGVRCYAITKY